MSVSARLLFAVVMVSLLAGCALPPSPSVDVSPPSHPATWQATPLPEADLETTWLHALAPEHLPDLLLEALKANPSLGIAAARVRQARALRPSAASARRPSIDLTASGSGSDSRAASEGGFDAGRESWQLAAEVAWEPDLWRRVGREVTAAAFDLAAAEADAEATAVSLLGEVSLTWLRLQEARLQEDLAQETMQSFSNSLGITERRFRTGLDALLDVQLARASTLESRQALEARTDEVQTARRALASLLGRYPENDSFSETPQLPEGLALPGGPLPGTLLERRPDVRAAWSRLSAAESRAGAARADLLPRLNLGAAAGTRGDTTGSITDDDFTQWNLRLRERLYTGGLRQAEITRRAAVLDERFDQWRSAVLVAWNEVETLLERARHLELQLQHLREAVAAYREAESLALEQYIHGLVDITTVLDAQRRLFLAESRRLQVHRQLLGSRVRLYVALGGQSPEGVAP